MYICCIKQNHHKVGVVVVVVFTAFAVVLCLVSGCKQRNKEHTRKFFLQRFRTLRWNLRVIN